MILSYRRVSAEVIPPKSSFILRRWQKEVRRNFSGFWIGLKKNGGKKSLKRYYVFGEYNLSPSLSQWVIFL